MCVLSFSFPIHVFCLLFRSSKYPKIVWYMIWKTFWYWKWYDGCKVSFNFQFLNNHEIRFILSIPIQTQEFQVQHNFLPLLRETTRMFNTYINLHQKLQTEFWVLLGQGLHFKTISLAYNMLTWNTCCVMLIRSKRVWR